MDIFCFWFLGFFFDFVFGQKFERFRERGCPVRFSIFLCVFVCESFCRELSFWCVLYGALRLVFEAMAVISVGSKFLGRLSKAVGHMGVFRGALMARVNGW